MSRVICVSSLPLVGVLLTAALARAAAPPTSDRPMPRVAEATPALLAAHCGDCHGVDDAQASFRVDTLSQSIDTVEMAERWQKVLDALNSGQMPPKDAAQIDAARKIELLDDLSHAMVAARKSLADQGSDTLLRRLNRREYRNTLRQLLGVTIDVNELPADTRPGGFDTSGSNLFMSGDQFDQYRALGSDAVREAFARVAAVGQERTLRVEAEASHAAFLAANEKSHDEHRRAKLWCDAVLAAANRPENADVLAELRKRAPSDWQLVHQWKRIPGAPAADAFGWPKDFDEQVLWELNVNAEFIEYEKRYLAQPHLDTGGYLTLPGAGRSSYANNWYALRIPADWPPGDYVVRIRAAATPQAPPDRRYLEMGVAPYPPGIPATSVHHVAGTLDEPAVIEIPYTVLAKHDARARMLFIRERDAGQVPVAVARFKEAQQANGVGPDLAVWIDWLEIERLPDGGREVPPGIAALGIPFDDRGATLEPAAIKAALGRFVLEAYRGVSAPRGYLDRLLAGYAARRAAGATHPVALEETLSSVLASPRFLYLAEPSRDDDDALDSQKLACRLSYLLWGEPPDGTLRRKARGDGLRDPAVLDAECRRLLDDPRVNGFVEPFVSQWLAMDRLDFFQFDRRRFPRFDDAVKESARREVDGTFADVLRRNGRLGELLAADSVVVNGVLAGYYGIEGVNGDAFRRVSVPAGSPRGGLLGMAAIHAMGSDGERSSPVERGAWVLRKLVDDPPPPAPPNVPQVARLAGKSLTTQERLVAHQEEPQCASCHRRIDPPGFALENFDAVGAWRTEDSYTPVDKHGQPNAALNKTWPIEVAGSFHGGAPFVGFEGFRDAVAARERDFARGFAKALVEYALGRPCGFRDEPLVDAMVARAEAKDFAIREFILGLVQSDAFRSK
jgi:mono/diheme cytochrome c family protein